jgi:hypothetical protein
MTWKQLCTIGRHCSSHVLLVDCNIVIKNVVDDLSYQWHGSSSMLLVDCIVISGLLDEGTKTLVSRGNLDMSWGTLVP